MIYFAILALVIIVMLAAIIVYMSKYCEKVEAENRELSAKYFLLQKEQKLKNEAKDKINTGDNLTNFNNSLDVLHNLKS